MGNIMHCVFMWRYLILIDNSNEILYKAEQAVPINGDNIPPSDHYLRAGIGLDLKYNGRIPY